MIAAMCIPISLAQSFAYVDGRHRLEIEWAVLILTAIGAVAVLRRLSGRSVAGTVPSP